MKIVIYLVLAALIFGVLRTHRSVGKSGGGKSRSNAIRVSAFSWLLAVIFLIAFTFLPNGPRIALVLQRGYRKESSGTNEASQLMMNNCRLGLGNF